MLSDEYAMQQVEALLLLHRPMEFEVIVGMIEAVFMVPYEPDPGVLSDVCVIVSLATGCVAVFRQNREYLLATVFRPV